ncbi:hypothetical protein RBSWK_05797 [Rhodopirellula baltica SWK14]|uniref:Uncharacterized protein n=1 Tax=Rhodopirellula baltica SWK14 TaxID=993516 RepID=L7C8Y2_RHOBT|nr:hypothetical protein RBSWK_05797 [Rhodopirellula baltica SWK14]
MYRSEIQTASFPSSSGFSLMVDLADDAIRQKKNGRQRFVSLCITNRWLGSRNLLRAVMPSTQTCGLSIHRTPSDRR